MNDQRKIKRREKKNFFSSLSRRMFVRRPPLWLSMKEKCGCRRSLYRGITTTSQEMSFEDHIEAFRHKSTWEVVRALAILRLCTVRGVADHSLSVLSWAHRLGADRLVLKPTIYEQFVGGESDTELRCCMRRVAAQGMRSMLAATMEEDIGEKRNDDVNDSNCQRILHSIRMASEEAPDSPMVQLKLSGLLPANLLVTLGQMYVNCEDKMQVIEPIAQGLMGKSMQLYEKSLTPSDMKALYAAIQRFKKICLEAKVREVKVLVDSEYTYLNKGLSLLTLGAAAVFNIQSPLIWNTYQCYLKDAQRKIKEEMRFIKERLGCHFGAKIVRGAYMLQERRRAFDLGIPDPLCEDYDATSRNYNSVLTYILKEVTSSHLKCQFIVASHNEESIKFTIKRMSALNLDKGEGSVKFGQLYGMCDQVSITLAKSGFLIYKSIPYGTLEEVLPYLARRAIENRSVLERAKKERTLLGKELKLRITKAIRN